jgi:hypothetical protein
VWRIKKFILLSKLKFGYNENWNKVFSVGGIVDDIWIFIGPKKVAIAGQQQGVASRV